MKNVMNPKYSSDILSYGKHSFIACLPSMLLISAPRVLYASLSRAQTKPHISLSHPVESSSLAYLGKVKAEKGCSPSIMDSLTHTLLLRRVFSVQLENTLHFSTANGLDHTL